MHDTHLDLALAALRADVAEPPPASAGVVGDGARIEIAAEFLGHFVRLGGLEPHHSVIDIGCGNGRIATGLRHFLDPLRGRYLGFDPVAGGIDWCRQVFADLPHFRFEWSDLYNELYAPDGENLALRYRFPAEDGSTDFVMATSVFTHLYDLEIEAYLLESARVLKPGGRLFATAFLIDDKPPPPPQPHLDFNVRAGRDGQRFHVAGYPPLAAVAYRTDYFRALAERGLQRPVTILPGFWRGGAGPAFQDLVLA